MRPLNEREKQLGSGEGYRAFDNSVVEVPEQPETGPDGTARRPVPQRFEKVFGPEASQQDVYTQVQPVVRAALEGVNATVFAYGQTSAGKTYTMQGERDAPGIIPHALADIFQSVAQSKQRTYRITVAYLELYNEEMFDLLGECLDDSGQMPALPVREDPERGVYVDGLREEPVDDYYGAARLLAAGEQRRHVAATLMNRQSSRSHTIFRLSIESEELSSGATLGESGGGLGPVMCSTLALVDLAGSERGKRRGGNFYAARFTEGCFINQSLLTLGMVIRKLAAQAHKNRSSATLHESLLGEDAGPTHVPYRDSKLTRLLQPALGGNARAAVVCCATPAREHIDETRSTIHFANACRLVVNHATVNEVTSDAALVARYERELATLRGKLQEAEREKARLSLALQKERARGGGGSSITAEDASPVSARRRGPSPLPSPRVGPTAATTTTTSSSGAGGGGGGASSEQAAELARLRAEVAKLRTSAGRDTEVEDALLAEGQRLRSELSQAKRQLAQALQRERDVPASASHSDGRVAELEAEVARMRAEMEAERAEARRNAEVRAEASALRDGLKRAESREAKLRDRLREQEAELRVLEEERALARARAVAAPSPPTAKRYSSPRKAPRPPPLQTTTVATQQRALPRAWTPEPDEEDAHAPAPAPPPFGSHELWNQQAPEPPPPEPVPPSPPPRQEEEAEAEEPRPPSNRQALDDIEADLAALDSLDLELLNDSMTDPAFWDEEGSLSDVNNDIFSSPSPPAKGSRERGSRFVLSPNHHR